MNTIDNNRGNISFGIAFKLYKNERGVKTADLLDCKEELAMYKNIAKKLKTDKFIKTELGINSENSSLVKTDYNGKQSFKYKSNGEEYAFENSFLSRAMGVRKAFGKVKAAYESIVRKNS